MHSLHKYTAFPLGLLKNIPKTHGRQVNPEIPLARLLKKQHNIPPPLKPVQWALTTQLAQVH